MQRILVALAVIAGVARADRAPESPEAFRLALRSSDQILAMLADPVRVAGLVFTDAACTKRFTRAQQVIGATDRRALGDCVRGLHPFVFPHQVDRTISLTVPVGVSVGAADLLLDLELLDGKIVAIHGAAARDGTPDAELPTIAVPPKLSVVPVFVPTRNVDPKIARDVAFKLCHDAQGAITSRRLVRGSGSKAIDDAIAAHYAKVTSTTPVVFEGAKPAALCQVTYPLR